MQKNHFSQNSYKFTLRNKFNIVILMIVLIQIYHFVENKISHRFNIINIGLNLIFIYEKTSKKFRLF
jgi:hypothetical protein